jgi:peptidase M28-like protein
MKKLLLLLFAFNLFVTLSFGQNSNGVNIKQQSISITSNSEDTKTVDPAPLADVITSESLRKHLTIIASDNFEGRETGTSGNEKAANYIADQFKSFGLPAFNNGSYFQDVILNWTKWEDANIYVDDTRYKHLWDFVSFPNKNEELIDFTTDEVIFLGYGIDDPKYSDYNRADVKGKVILIYKGEPINKKGNSLITGKNTLSEWTDNPDKKLEIAKQKGVKAVLVIEEDIQKVLSESRRFLISPQLTLGELSNEEIKTANSLSIKTNIAKAIMGKQYKKVLKARKKMLKKGKSRSVTLPTKLVINLEKNQRTIRGVNVMGFIEGSDPKLKDEIVVVSAHYDHLGKRGEDIFNGADDNGSGTSTTIEVARAFAEAKKQGNGPKRSILALLVTGEEKGLLGSKFYAERPVFPLENTVADVNVDMVGRVDEKHSDNPDYVYVIGSDRLSTELHEINESVNSKYTNLILDYTYNEDDDPNRYYYRSDHYNFAEKGIPAIFYFNGTHDDYHRPSDTIEKINFEKMAKIARLVFHTTWELANRDKRIEVNVTGRN